MGAKRLEVLNEALPNARRVAVRDQVLAQAQTDLAVAEAIGLKAQLIETRRDEYEETFNEAIGARAEAIEVPRFACVSILGPHGASLTDPFRGSAGCVAKFLHAAKPEISPSNS